MMPRTRRVVSAGLTVFLYLAAYAAYRATHVEVWVKNDRPYVIFGSRASYYFFRPLSYLDQAVTGMGFHIGPHR